MGMHTRRGRAWWAAGAMLAVGLCGCPGDTELAKGDAANGDGSRAGGGASGSRGGGAGGSGVSGSGGGNAGSGSGSGSSGSGGGGHAGSGTTAGRGAGGAGGAAGGGGETCPPGIAIPAICKLCADGSCGQPVCKGGVFTGDFQCAGEGGAGSGSGGAGGGGGDSGGCVHAGCSNQLCVEASTASTIVTDCVFREEYACYQAAECALQSDGQCGFTESQTLSDCLAGSGGGSLKWFATCGAPVCSSQADPDDPSVPNCTDAMQPGSACDAEGETCETLACGGHRVCATSDPKGLVGCPISRARWKQGIEYLDQAELQSLHDEITHLPLATWQYKSAPGVPRLGFIIDDVEPSAAVAGDHVDVYGYLSMAVAAIQVQQRDIEALQSQLAALREDQADPAAQVCGPLGP